MELIAFCVESLNHQSLSLSGVEGGWVAVDSGGSFKASTNGSRD